MLIYIIKILSIIIKHNVVPYYYIVIYGSYFYKRHPIHTFFQLLFFYKLSCHIYVQCTYSSFCPNDAWKSLIWKWKSHHRRRMQTSRKLQNNFVRLGRTGINLTLAVGWTLWFFIFKGFTSAIVDKLMGIYIQLCGGFWKWLFVNKICDLNKHLLEKKIIKGCLNTL